jgi:Fe-S cluster assembly ATP-binding protein
MLLEIKDLRVRAENKDILKGLNLSVNSGEVHAIMGPNGSGKSTLARALAGHPGYEVTGGSITSAGHDLLELDPEVRACEGIFMAFQYPVEIPGINNSYFLKAALNAVRKHRGEPELDAVEFMKLIKDKAKLLQMDPAMLNRAVNEGFSGGNALRSPDRAMLVVTHYQRLLNYIVPDIVHVLTDGRIVRSGGKDLALELEAKGYGWIDAGLAGARG